MAKPAAAAQHTTGDEVEDGVMATSSQYFGFLFARWRQEQAKDLTKTMGEVQEAVYREWVERGGSPGGSGATAPATQKTKAKRVRDPNEPKKPLSAFMIYRKDKQAEVMVELPGLKPSQVGQCECYCYLTAFFEKEANPFQNNQVSFIAWHKFIKTIGIFQHLAGFMMHYLKLPSQEDVKVQQFFTSKVLTQNHLLST